MKAPSAERNRGTFLAEIPPHSGKYLEAASETKVAHAVILSPPWDKCSP